MGRRSELAEILAAWRDACSGQPAGILISGEAGVGKSRLVPECADHVLSTGGSVLSGSGVRISTGGLPYGPILDALRRFLHEKGAVSFTELFGPAYADLDALLRADDIVSHAGADTPARLRQGRLFELFLALLTQLAENAPLLFVIEDVHWAEQSTLDLLTFLTATLRRERVLVLVTYRDDEASSGALPSALLELFRSPFLTSLALAPFEPPELAVLLERLAGAPLPAATLARITDLSGGNPFFAEELLSAEGLQTARALPARVRDVVLLRVATLSPHAQHVVRLVAVAGRRAGHALVAAVCALPEPALLAALRELVTNGVLLADTDSTYRFRHALAQEAIYSDLLPGECARAHELFAAALSESPHLCEGPVSTRSAVIAHHWQAAGNGSRALAAAVVAGRAAMEIHGYTEALQFFQRALGLWDEVEDTGACAIDRPELLAAAARCAHYLSLHDLAVQLTEQALGELPETDVVRRALQYEALGTYLSWSDGARALAALTDAHRLLGDSGPTRERARVTAALAQALSIHGRYDDSAPLWEQALALSRAAGCRREEVRGLRTSGWHLAMHGEPDQGLARMREALRVATAASDLEGICVTYNDFGLLLEVVGRSEECLATVEAALRWSSDAGLCFTPMVEMLDSIVFVLFRLGQWRRAEEVVERFYPEHQGSAYTQLTETALAELATARGRPEEAQLHLKLARETMEGHDVPSSHLFVSAAAAGLAVLLREHDRGRQEVERALEIAAACGDEHQAVALCALGLRVEADEAERRRARGVLGRGDDVLVHGDELHGRAVQIWSGLGPRQVSFPQAAVEAVAAEAEFDRLLGRASPGRWAEVAGGWERLCRPYPAAYARWREAEARVACRDADAPDALRRAHAAAKDLGARVLVEETTALARRARIDLALPAPLRSRPDAAPNLFNLTERELQVLAMVRTGRTNREIARKLYISESTASVHVSNILTKLDAKNRVEAAAIAHRLDLGTSLVRD